MGTLRFYRDEKEEIGESHAWEPRSLKEIGDSHAWEPQG